MNRMSDRQTRGRNVRSAENLKNDAFDNEPIKKDMSSNGDLQ